MREHVVSDLHAFPAIIPVHGEETPDDGGNAPRTQFCAFVLQGLQRLSGASRRRVATVEECMDMDIFQARAHCHFQHGVDMCLVTVYAAGRKQTQNMQCRPALLGRLHGLDQRQVGIKAAIFYGQIDLGQILVHHASGADVQMAHFRVAHLAVGQADTQLRCIHQCMRILTPQFVPIWFARIGDSIEIGIFAIAESVQNEQ